jgi:hypothetical protein
MKIIVTDADSRKAYDIINILKYVYGYKLILFSSTGFRLQLPAIYGQAVHKLELESAESFRNGLNEALSLEKDTDFCYLAVSEKATLYLYDYLKNEDKYAGRIRYLLPDLEAFNLARNKKQFQKFCENEHLPVPQSFGPHNLVELETDFRPVIAKKNVGTGSVGMIYVEEKEQLHLLDNIEHDDYLIQEKVESDQNIYGGFFLCQYGETVAYHGHRRIRTFPEKGGVTVFSSTDYTEEIKVIGEKLLRKLNWNGFAMIEFMYDKQRKQWKIIELNPRLWGSVMLSEFCGASFLDNYVRLCDNKELVNKAVLSNRYIRWIFPFEILNFLKRKISLKELYNISEKPICYINFTYGKWYNNILFQLFFTLNARSVNRFFKKIFS